MNWGEFKKRVEAAGVNDDAEIDFIDWSNIWNTVTVEYCESGINITDIKTYEGEDEDD